MTDNQTPFPSIILPGFAGIQHRGLTGGWLASPSYLQTENDFPPHYKGLTPAQSPAVKENYLIVICENIM